MEVLEQIAALTDRPFTIYRAISGRKAGRFYNNAHWVFRTGTPDNWIVVRAWTADELIKKVLNKLSSL